MGVSCFNSSAERAAWFKIMQEKSKEAASTKVWPCDGPAEREANHRRNARALHDALPAGLKSST